MDRPRSTRGWKVSWKMLLLAAASILSSCFLLTRAQETTGICIRVAPEVLKEGDRVTLTPEGLDLKKLSNCKWYRGAIGERNIIIIVSLTPVIGRVNGPAYTGRETVNPDCSLLITDLKPSDSGTYSFNPEGFGVTNTGAINIAVSAGIWTPYTCREAPTLSISSMHSQTAAGTIISTTEELSDLHKEKNFTDTEKGPVNHSKSLVATIVIVAVLLVLVIAGFLLYFFLCVRRKSYGTPTQVIYVTPLYENISPAQKVMHNSSSGADQVYESLQHGDQNVYNELIFKQNPSEVPSVGSSP